MHTIPAERSTDESVFPRDIVQSRDSVFPPHDEELRARVAASVDDIIDSPRVTSVTPLATLARAFQDTRLPERPVSAEAYFAYLLREVVPHAVNMGSPRCLGHMTGGTPSFVRVLSDLVVALNQNLVKREASRAFTLLERQTLGTLHRLAFDESDAFYAAHTQQPCSTLGIVCAGSTLANITALWIARNRALAPDNGGAEPETDGLLAALEHHGLRGAVFIGSRLMHYSIDKAASLLGLGTRAVLKLPVDERNRLDLRRLRQTVDDCARDRRRILAIVGTAGTTDCGSIDPLPEMARIAREARVHFHVDAAWGTPLLFSARHRTRLAGIELADSVTLDGHKQLHLPAGANALLLRDPQLARVIEKQANYMLHEGSGDLGKRSLEGSRAASSLFLHAALHLVGRAGYEVAIDRCIRMAERFAALVGRSPEFELLAEPETNIVVYRYLPPSLRRGSRSAVATSAQQRRIDDCNERLQKTQSQAGHALVSRTTLSAPGTRGAIPVVALRAVFANASTTEADFAAVLAEQREIGAALWQTSSIPQTD